MNSPAELIRYVLSTAGVFVTPGAVGMSEPPVWPVYVGHMPSVPDNAACVYDTPGAIDGREMRGGRTVRHPGFQVRVRALDHSQGFSKIREIQEALDAVQNLSVAIGDSSYTIIAVKQTGGAFSLGQEPDVQRRVAFTINGQLTYKEE